MIRHLTIHNYAIVSALEIDLSDGFTVLTGETGAGKSITFEAINYALGSRADSKIVRQGADRCDIIAEFDVRHQPDVMHWLEQQNLADEEHCLLKRSIYKDGRSRSLINGQPCPLSTTRELASLLVHIHGQHENQQLLKPDGQRALLDAYAAHSALVQNVQDCYQAYAKTEQALAQRQQAQSQSDRLAFLAYQLEELVALELDTLSLPQLETSQTELANAEQILQSCDTLRQLIADDEKACLKQLRQSQLQLSTLPDSPLKQSSEQLLAQAVSLLTDFEANIHDLANRIDVDPEKLQTLNNQLDAIFRIARKHRIPPSELSRAQQKLENEIECLQRLDTEIASLEKAAQQQHAAYEKAAHALSASRLAAAKKLEKTIVHTLKTLDMPHCKFEVRCIDAAEKPRRHGRDTIQFLIQPNPGQPLQALNKIASGGELSRIALAIQVATAGAWVVPTLLFDEIDVGVSGSTAAVIGKLLQQLGQQAQILCVTHQAQVASFADQHYRVSKVTDGKNTESVMDRLNPEAQIAEIARMLGGMEVTQQTLAHASELLTQAQQSVTVTT